jgi:hypothetical protein
MPTPPIDADTYALAMRYGYTNQHWPTDAGATPGPRTASQAGNRAQSHGHLPVPTLGYQSPENLLCEPHLIHTARARFPPCPSPHTPQPRATTIFPRHVPLTAIIAYAIIKQCPHAFS